MLIAHEDDIVTVRQRVRRIGRAARLRRAGPDPDRHGGLRDRAQRLSAMPAAAGSSSASTRTATARSWSSASATRVRASPTVVRSWRDDTARAPASASASPARAGSMDRFEISSASARARSVTFGKAASRGRPSAHRPEGRRPGRGGGPARIEDPKRRDARAEPRAPAQPRPSWPSARRKRGASTPNSPRPTGAWWRSTPSWRRKPGSCARRALTWRARSRAGRPNSPRRTSACGPRR